MAYKDLEINGTFVAQLTDNINDVDASLSKLLIRIGSTDWYAGFVKGASSHFMGTAIVDYIDGTAQTGIITKWFKKVTLNYAPTSNQTFSIPSDIYGITIGGTIQGSGGSGAVGGSGDMGSLASGTSGGSGGSGGGVGGSGFDSSPVVFGESYDGLIDNSIRFQISNGNYSLVWGTATWASTPENRRIAIGPVGQAGGGVSGSGSPGGGGGGDAAIQITFVTWGDFQTGTPYEASGKFYKSFSRSRAYTSSGGEGGDGLSVSGTAPSGVGKGGRGGSGGKGGNGQSVTATQTSSGIAGPFNSYSEAEAATEPNSWDDANIYTEAHGDRGGGSGGFGEEGTPGACSFSLNYWGRAV